MKSDKDLEWKVLACILGLFVITICSSYFIKHNQNQVVLNVGGIQIPSVDFYNLAEKVNINEGESFNLCQIQPIAKCVRVTKNLES